MYQEDVIELYNKLGDVKAKIVSGIHGFDRQPNYWEPYADALAKDRAYFGEEIVYDFLKIKDDADLLASLFNTDGDTILAWCFSQEIGENLLNRIMYGGF